MLKSEAIDNCAVLVPLNVITRKWKAIILYHLSKGEKRFIEIWKVASNMNKKELIDYLVELENDGLIKRDINEETPPKEIYLLTEKGWSSIPAVENKLGWC